MEAKDYIQALLDAGLTQQQIAARIGTSQGTVSKVLRGETKDVLSRVYRKLGDVHAEVIGTADAQLHPTDGGGA